MNGNSAVKMRIGAVATAAALLCLASVLGADDALTPRWKFNKGDKRNFKISQVQEMAGMMKIASTQMVTEEVVDAAEGRGSIARTVTAIKADVQSQMMGNVQFDSEKKEDEAKKANPLVMGLTGVLNQTVTVELNARGEVGKLVGLEKIVAKLGPMGMMQKGVIEQGIKQGYVAFPEKAIKVGDTWDQSSSFSSPQGQVTLTFRYTFEGTEKRLDFDCVKLSMKLFAGVSRAGGGDDDGGDDLGDDDAGDEHPKKGGEHPKKDSDRDDKPGKNDDEHPAGGKTGTAKGPAGGDGLREVGSGTVYFAIQEGFAVEMETVMSAGGGGGGKTTSILVK